MRGSTIITCAYCGKESRMQNYRLKEGRKNFCNRGCFTKYQREFKDATPRYAGGPVKHQCSNCGKDTYRNRGKISKTGRYFCSVKCRQEFSRGEFAPYYNDALVTMTCDNCGVEFKKFKSNVKDRNFCCRNCASEYHSGENNPLWKGGTSFYPYCEKFNKEFKDRVRAFFDYKCVLCGKTKSGNGDKELCVHHVHYDKSSCCSDAPRQFVALCQKCHAKTNHNRDAWSQYFEDLITKKYDGKSYFTKSEMVLLTTGG